MGFFFPCAFTFLSVSHITLSLSLHPNTLSTIRPGRTLDFCHSFRQWDTLIGLIPSLPTHHAAQILKQLARTINPLSINPSEVSAPAHPYQVPGITQPCVLPCGFLSLLTNSTSRFALGLPHTLNNCTHHLSTRLHLFHLHMNQLVCYSSFPSSISSSPPLIFTPRRPPCLKKRWAHTMHFTGRIG